MSESAPDQPPRTRHGKAKRHHYVPEMILRRFAGPDLHLWSFDKRHPGYGIERKPIARLFREWDLYTSVDAAGGRDRSAETRLSVMESRASPVLDRRRPDRGGLRRFQTQIARPWLTSWSRRSGGRPTPSTPSRLSGTSMPSLPIGLPSGRLPGGAWRMPIALIY